MRVILPVETIEFLKNQNKLLLKNNNYTVSVLCPNIMFYNKMYVHNSLSFMFSNKHNLKTFLKHIAYLTVRLNKLYFIKLKVRGLGYRFKKLSSHLYRFYFTRTNYIYFHKPNDIMIKSRKRRIILLSNNLQRLHLIFNQLLLLHNVGPYNRRGFTYPRRIIKLKPGKKIL